MADRRRTLDHRIAWVQRRLEDVPRRGHAEVTTRSGSSYSYDYILEADLMSGIRPLLAAAGIAFYYSDEILAVGEGAARVRVHFTLAAAGDERTFFADGYATDLGDKHVNKAKTTAVRYWLWKTFLQPSDEDDPEQGNVPAADAAHADEARRRAEALRRGSSTRRTDPAPSGAQTTGQLRERLMMLANELDEIHGVPPGRSVGALLDLVRQEHGAPLAELASHDVVRIARAYADHVTAEREARDRDGLTFMPTEFALPRG